MDEDYVTLELDASRHGWCCSGCKLFSDSLGRPVFGTEIWSITSKGTAWLENKPNYIFCPKCGKKVRKNHA